MFIRWYHRSSPSLFNIISILYFLYKLNGNLISKEIPLTLFGSWSGTSVAYKIGDVVVIKFSSVSNNIAAQPLLLLPEALRSDKAIGLCNLVADVTDNKTLKQVIINTNYQIGLCGFGWSDWYDVGHKYTGEIVYIL